MQILLTLPSKWFNHNDPRDVVLNSEKLKNAEQKIVAGGKIQTMLCIPSSHACLEFRLLNSRYAPQYNSEPLTKVIL
jgi:hypothetical protein